MSMNHQSFEPRETFGWLKTLGLIIVVFALMIGTGVLAAKADACTDACRVKHNQCRLETKGAPACDSQVNACVQACVATLTKGTPAKPSK
jgi:hypothetical protein